MALKAETKTKIKALGLDVDKLIAAITAEAETDYEVPEVVVFKQAELDARDANKVLEGKKLGVTEGEMQGKELAAKAFKKKFGIDDPTKEIDKVIELASAKAATGDEGLKQQVALLIADKEKLTGEVTAAKTAADAAIFDSQLISMFPPNRDANLSDAERLTLVKMQLGFDTVDGKKVTKKNGEVLRDAATQNPIEPGKAITDFFTERKWISADGTGEGGRGGGNNHGAPGAGGLKKYSQVEAAWIAANPTGNPISPEFQTYLEAATKDVPDFDFNS